MQSGGNVINLDTSRVVVPLLDDRSVKMESVKWSQSGKEDPSSSVGGEEGGDKEMFLMGD